MQEPKNKVQYYAIEELKLLENNPRTITAKQMETLKKSVKDNPDYFEARPLILSNRTGELVIIAGNQRYRAAKELGLRELPCVLLEGLNEAREQEIIIRDNVSNGDWDMDILANEWDTTKLGEWGLPFKLFPDEYEEMVSEASEHTKDEWMQETDYDLNNLVRKTLNPELWAEIEKAEKDGKLHPEIATILKARAQQCTIFNFDELCKFYRSEDASEEEKHLLEELYLVFITPKELFEKGIASFDRITGRIVSKHLMEGGDDDDEED